MAKIEIEGIPADDLVYWLGVTDQVPGGAEICERLDRVIEILEGSRIAEDDAEHYAPQSFVDVPSILKKLRAYDFFAGTEVPKDKDVKAEECRWCGSPMR